MPRRTDEEQAEFRNALQSVAAQKELPVVELDALSMLEGDDVGELRRVWSELDTAARARLVRSLHVAAEQRLRLDFSAVNLLGLNDPDPRVRLASVQCTIEDRSAAWLNALLHVLRQDPEAELRLAAAEDLARFTLLAELDDLDPDATATLRARLVESVHDEAEDVRVRSAALAALGYFSDQTVAGELAAGFLSPAVRLGAIRGMGRTADPTWTDRLMPVLGSDDPDQRMEAARALGEIEDERAVVPLVEIIEDPDPDAQLAVIEALGRIGGEEAREALLFVAEISDDTVRAAAERALATLEEADDDDF